MIVGFDDYPTISAAYKTIIERLHVEIPNIDTDRSIIGGHSNGAKTVNVLLSSMDETTLATFNGLLFVDGGTEWSSLSATQCGN